MLGVKKEDKGNALLIWLEGSLEDNPGFDQIIGSPRPFMQVNCKSITRINSVGVKAWIAYFQRCFTAGSALEFTECSPAIMQQLNTISSFRCNATISSVIIPFFCEQCSKSESLVCAVKELVKIQFKVPVQKCPSCSGSMIFDDDPDEYFTCFLQG